MTSQPHNLDAARQQEAELDAIEASLLRHDQQLRFRHAMAAARLAAARDRQHAIRLRMQAIDGMGSNELARAPAVEDVEPRAQMSASGSARLAVAAQRREYLAMLAAALQNWERHLALAEASVEEAIRADEGREAAWVEQEPALRKPVLSRPPSDVLSPDGLALDAAGVAQPGLPVAGPQYPADGVAAAATKMPLSRVTGRQSTALAAAGEVELSEVPQPRGPTKRMTTTPLFRPAESHTVTGALAVPRSTATPPARARSAPQPVATKATPKPSPASPAPASPAATAATGPDPQPRTRVLVDSAPEMVARHAETVSLEPNGAEAPAIAARLRAKRRPESPPVRKRESDGLPNEMPADLPSGHPQPPQRHRDATAPFLATLTFCGLPLMRQSIEYDQVGRHLLLSFHGAAPALQTESELLWRDRDGTRYRFGVQVVQAVPAQGGGTVVVLDIAAWSAEDRAAMQTVMARLL